MCHLCKINLIPGASFFVAASRWLLYILLLYQQFYDDLPKLLLVTEVTERNFQNMYYPSLFF